ncbi:MAG: 16S rRNA (guanine(966)-N(2))-methyltransferase RsmD [Pseudobdellovibrionaceae bacterium]
MRIISGQFKGQLLVSFNASHIRPTTDRVKGSLFNKLQDRTVGATVLDLFCGTGSLGLEALSREAKNCTFVDDNKKSLQITSQNIEKLKLPKSVARLVHKDVIEFLKSYKGDPFDLIFVDPPFTEKMAHLVMLALQNSAVFGPQSLISIESGHKEPILDEYKTLFRFDKRDFGDKVLSLFSQKES